MIGYIIMISPVFILDGVLLYVGIKDPKNKYPNFPWWRRIGAVLMFERGHAKEDR